MGKRRLEHLTWLLSADKAGSVLIAQTTSSMHMRAHCVYGYRAGDAGPVISFNGEWLVGSALGYLLGNGYRLYSPVLMRFVSADDLSPFGEGGYNSYAYCVGDPVNRADPSGHRFSMTGLLKHLRIMNRTGRRQQSSDIGKQIYRHAESDRAVRQLRSDPQENGNAMLNNPSEVFEPQGDVLPELTSLRMKNDLLNQKVEVLESQVVVQREIAIEQQGVITHMLKGLGVTQEEIRGIVHRDLERIAYNVNTRLPSTR